MRNTSTSNINNIRFEDVCCERSEFKFKFKFKFKNVGRAALSDLIVSMS